MYDVYMHANQKYISTMSTPKYHDTQIRQPNSNTGEKTYIHACQSFINII